MDMSTTEYSSREGRIELIIGPMFAGKTTELIRRVRRELFARRSCYIIKHSRDLRYSSECVSSHDKQLFSASCAVPELHMVGDAWRSYDVIAVDEGQFFPDIVEFCDKVAGAGKTVIVSALDGDYRRRPFGDICRLIPLAEYVKKLSSVCMRCHSRSASFTYRTASSDEQELVGGADMYIATCRSCYTTKEQEQKKVTHHLSVGRSPNDSTTITGKQMEQQQQQQQDQPEHISTPESKTAAILDSPSSPIDLPAAVSALKRPADGDIGAQEKRERCSENLEVEYH